VTASRAAPENVHDHSEVGDIMKFVYVDESGSQGHTDVFVMAGLLVDAYRLRTCTAAFDQMIIELLAKHPGAPKELKTSDFISGAGGWSKVDAAERKQFLEKVCDLATEYATVFAVAFSFEKFKEAPDSGQKEIFGNSYWVGAAMFVAALI
jgi:Protein of unknown function (DUF3800)